MKLKSLNAALLAAGVLAMGTAGAFEIPSWFKRAPVVGQAATGTQAGTQVAAANVASAPVPMVAAEGLVPNYRAIVKQAGPAVVGITVEGMHKASMEERGAPPGADDDPFYQFFRGIPGLDPRNRGDSSVPFRGQGSGFIVSADGLVLTNAHVVREAKEVTVKLSDRREFSAKVLGTDPVTDVAVLRIEASNLPTVRLGNPNALEVGDRVLAIGAPFGLEQTATQGIVSAKGRSLPGDSVVPFIQTDAAVNPGNSGGPLFDGSGAVVGINAQIYSRSGGFQGLSFAIPINVALKVKDQIVATGKATHARLGVTVQDLNQTLAQSFGLERPDGALVAQVAPRSAAAKAGLKSGDVVLSVNGEQITRSGNLSSLIGLSSPGDKVQLKVWRERGMKDMEVALGSADDAGKPVAEAEDRTQRGQIGLALRPLSPSEQRQSRIEQGMVVEGVSGPAARAGVEPGDVLLAINGKPVQSIEQVRGVMQGQPKSVALLVQRDGERIFVPVKLG
jgi:serine protease Do